MLQIERKPLAHPILKQNQFETECKERGGFSTTVGEYLTFPMLEQLGSVSHLISTRTGGVSEGELSTMNLSFTRGDREENVLENYRRIARVLHCEPKDMVGSHQTHTTNIRRVTAADKGKGIVCERDYCDIDGLICNEQGIVLVTYYADCVPLFVVDPVNRAIGLAHSGWRGTVNKMGRCMVEAMREQFGSNPAQLYAAVGPSICRECYEVSEDVAEQFAEVFTGTERDNIVTPGRQEGKYQLDLWLANECIFRECGIPREQISVTDICTCCNSEYLFSHRASGGRRGNIAAFLMLK